MLQAVTNAARGIVGRQRQPEDPPVEPVVVPTARDGLVVREFATVDDDRALFELAHRNEAHISSGGRPVHIGPTSRVGDITMDRRKRQQWRPEWRDLVFGIYDRGQLVGSLALTNSSENMSTVRGPSPDWTIEYWVDQDRTRQGIGSAAVGAVCRFAFGQRGARTEIIKALVWHENGDSLRMLEHLGFAVVPPRQNRQLYQLTSERWAQINAGQSVPD